MNSSEQFSWYAIHVVAKKETQIATVLSEKGYECFLPVYKKRTNWSDRIKITSHPLFSGYVFSRFEIQNRFPILVTPNVYGIVGAGKKPIAIPAQDLEAVKIALQNGMTVEPCDGLYEGDIVRVTKGPLRGCEGVFVRYHGGCRLVLSIQLINRAVAVEVDRLCVEPCAKQDVRAQFFTSHLT